MMRRLARFAAVAVSLLSAAGCTTTMSAGSHVDRGIDFARYRTYDWGPSDALPTSDSRLEKSPFFKDHMQGEVERQMTAKGFEGPTSRKPDLLIHYHANISRRLNVNGVTSGYGSCYDECRERITEYEAGTLVLDIMDARSKKVVWRGWAQDSMEDVIANPDRLAREIRDAVTRMMAQLPRRA